MIIKSLKLLNFRQFLGEQEMYFPIKEDKNITIVIANNGTGKTTLEQSFTWILFGETSFKRKDVFNSELVKKTKDNHTIKAEGILTIEHLNKEYKIKRSETAKKTNSRISNPASNLEISFKENGLSKVLYNDEANVLINDIIPKNLHQYFFFDGEKIEKIGKEIDKGKSREFALAVRGMLGFNAMYNAKNHLEKIIKSYQTEYNGDNDKEFIETKKRITDYKSDIDLTKNEIEAISDEIEELESLKSIISDEIKQYASVAEKQERFKNLEKWIPNKENSINAKMKDIFSHMSSNSTYFFAYNLMNRSKDILNESNLENKGIPGIDNDAIHYLLENGKCICGKDLNKDTEAREHLVELSKYLPPQNIGYLINSFSNYTNEYINSSIDFYEDHKSKRKEYSGLISEHDNYVSEYNRIAEEIKLIPDLKEKKEKEITYKNKIDSLNREIGGKQAEISRFESEISKLEKILTTLDTQDENNKLIQKFENVVREILEKIDKFSFKKEQEIRETLMIRINEIFSTIFNNNMKIEIDEDYNIEVINLEVDESLEKSSAQNVSITFSFIAGIINMARQKMESKSEDELEEDLVTEPYPLVMDAPLSSFDKTRIKNVCEILPDIAEQVIIFIKDTDGEIAKDYMINRISKEWILTQLSSTSTIIEEAF